RQRLTGREGKRPAIEAPDQRRNRRAGRLQVTLHAEIHAQFRREPGGIDDAGANLFAGRARGLRGVNVTGAGAMTALAVDPFRKVSAKDGLASRRVVPGWSARISIVAKDALIRDQPPGGGMARIETRAHGPVATFVRVPT